MNSNYGRLQVTFASKGVETSKDRLANHLKRPVAISGHQQDVIEVPWFDLVRTTAPAFPRAEARFQGLNQAGCADAQSMISVHCQKHMAFLRISLRLCMFAVRVAVHLLIQHFLERKVVKFVLLHDNLQQRE